MRIKKNLFLMITIFSLFLFWGCLKNGSNTSSTEQPQYEPIQVKDEDGNIIQGYTDKKLIWSVVLVEKRNEEDLSEFSMDSRSVVKDMKKLYVDFDQAKTQIPKGFRLPRKDECEKIPSIISFLELGKTQNSRVLIKSTSHEDESIVTNMFWLEDKCSPDLYCTCDTSGKIHRSHPKTRLYSEKFPIVKEYNNESK